MHAEEISLTLAQRARAQASRWWRAFRQSTNCRSPHGNSSGRRSWRRNATTAAAPPAYMCDFRAARCHPDQIVIVAGMQQALLISPMAALNPREQAWVEAL